MEGSLSKWTNVMKGWQYRWFVLDDNAGLLSYYTVSNYQLCLQHSIILRLGQSWFFVVWFEREYEIQLPSVRSELFILKGGNILNQLVV